MKCLFCTKDSQAINEFFLLTDGTGIHNQCLHIANDTIESLQRGLQQAQSNFHALQGQILKLTQKLEFYDTRFGRVIDLIGLSKKAVAETRLSQTQTELNKVENNFLELEARYKRASNKMSRFYDYWPTYPPDWHQRKDDLLEIYYSCVKCGGFDDLQVHHITPLGLGGSNTYDNLQVLCKKCHQKAHRTTFDKHKSQDSSSVSARGINKIRIIQEAIQNGSDLNIHYKGFNGDVTKRKINPLEISKEHGAYHLPESERDTTYVKAFCYLRNEKRTFKLRYITQIKIV